MFKHWIRIRFIQIIVDILFVFGVFQLAYFLQTNWQNHSDFPYSQYVLYSFLAMGLWIGFILFAKYYRVPPRSGERTLFDLFLILMGGTLSSGALIVLYFFTKDEIFSRMISFYGFSFGVLVLGLSYWIFRSQLKKLKKQKNSSYKTLIIGANRVSQKLIEKIKKDPFAPYQIFGVIDPYGLAKGKFLTTDEGEQIPLLGKLDKLDDVCKKQNITAIIQCDAFEHTINIISLAEEQDIKYQFDPALRGIFEENLRIRDVAGVPLISFVRRDFESGSRQKMYKFVDWGLRQFLDVG